MLPQASAGSFTCDQRAAPIGATRTVFANRRCKACNSGSNPIRIETCSDVAGTGRTSATATDTRNLIRRPLLRRRRWRLDARGRVWQAAAAARSRGAEGGGWP